MRYKLKPPGSIRINGRPTEVWYITWTDAGRSYRVSTKQADEAAARAFLATYHNAVTAAPETWNLAMLIDAYTAEHPGEAHHAKAVSRLMGHLTLSNLSRLQVRQFHAARRSEGASDSTINRQCRVLRAAIQWGYKDRWLTLDQIPHIEAPTPARARKRFLAYDEFLALYAAAASQHMRTFLALAIWTGQRAGAILELKWSDVDLDRALIFFPEATNDTKRRVRAVAINEPLALTLGSAVIQRDGEFVVSHNGQAIASTKKAFRRCVERAGLVDVRTHDLRRSAASWIIQNGGTLDDAALFLNDDIRTVQRHYGHLDETRLREISDRTAGHAHYARNGGK